MGRENLELSDFVEQDTTMEDRLHMLKKISVRNPNAHLITETFLYHVAEPMIIAGAVTGRNGGFDYGVGARVIEQPEAFLRISGNSGNARVLLQVWHVPLLLQSRKLLFPDDSTQQLPSTISRQSTIFTVVTDTDSALNGTYLDFRVKRWGIVGLDAWLLGVFVPDLIKRV